MADNEDLFWGGFIGVIGGMVCGLFIYACLSVFLVGFVVNSVLAATVCSSIGGGVVGFVLACNRIDADKTDMAHKKAIKTLEAKIVKLQAETKKTCTSSTDLLCIEKTEPNNSSRLKNLQEKVTQDDWNLINSQSRTLDGDIKLHENNE